MHTEAEGAAMTNSVRLDCNFTPARLNNLLDHAETEPYTLIIHLCRSLKLTKACK